MIGKQFIPDKKEDYSIDDIFDAARIHFEFDEFPNNPRIKEHIDFMRAVKKTISRYFIKIYKELNIDYQHKKNTNNKINPYIVDILLNDTMLKKFLEYSIHINRELIKENPDKQDKCNKCKDIIDRAETELRNLGGADDEEISEYFNYQGSIIADLLEDDTNEFAFNCASTILTLSSIQGTGITEIKGVDVNIPKDLINNLTDEDIKQAIDIVNRYYSKGHEKAIDDSIRDMERKIIIDFLTENYIDINYDLLRKDIALDLLSSNPFDSTYTGVVLERLSDVKNYYKKKENKD